VKPREQSSIVFIKTARRATEHKDARPGLTWNAEKRPRDSVFAQQGWYDFRSHVAWLHFRTSVNGPIRFDLGNERLVHG
jgi:hypothetical protein